MGQGSRPINVVTHVNGPLNCPFPHLCMQQSIIWTAYVLDNRLFDVWSIHSRMLIRISLFSSFSVARINKKLLKTDGVTSFLNVIWVLLNNFWRDLSAKLWKLLMLLNVLHIWSILKPWILMKGNRTIILHFLIIQRIKCIEIYIKRFLFFIFFFLTILSRKFRRLIETSLNIIYFFQMENLHFSQ